MGVKEILKSRRLELGLSMKELADKVGVNEATISRWESGNIANMKRDKGRFCLWIVRIHTMLY